MDVESLKNIFIFRGLRLPDLQRISRTLIEEKVEKGQALFWEDDPPEFMVLLKAGKVKLIKQSESGKETILGILSPGETVGEIALFDGRPYPFTAQAMEPSVILKMSRLSFFDFLAQTPSAGIEIIIELSRRLREAQSVIKGMAAERVEHRIVELLLKLAEKIGHQGEGGLRIGIVLTRQDIADMVGSTVETTIRTLSGLTKKGLIETRSKSLILKDVEALRRLILSEEDF